MNNCLTCGGLIPEPNKAYGYAGPICHCLVIPKIQKPEKYIAVSPTQYDELNKTRGNQTRGRRMSKLEFKAEDFEALFLRTAGADSFQQMADIANAKLNEWLEQQPVVYQYKSNGHGDWSHEIDEEFGGKKKYMNQARLVCIEPIVKDTAESLLRELLRNLGEMYPNTVMGYSLKDATWLERARALLAKGDS